MARDARSNTVAWLTTLPLARPQSTRRSVVQAVGRDPLLAGYLGCVLVLHGWYAPVDLDGVPMTSTPPASWPGLAGAGIYAAQQAARAAAQSTHPTTGTAGEPPALPCSACKVKDQSLSSRDREINSLKDEIERLKGDLDAVQGRLELMIPRSQDVQAETDSQLIKRLQEIDILQHRNIEAAERRVCELVAFLRGRNIPIPPEGGVAVPVATQSWNGIL